MGRSFGFIPELEGNVQIYSILILAFPHFLKNNVSYDLRITRFHAECVRIAWNKLSRKKQKK
jgi:hypothetical protein